MAIHQGKIAKAVSKAIGLNIIRRGGPVATFHSDGYLRHNARRLEHLASLRIPIAGMSVLEVGAGIGDHSHYYIDRGCDVTITEARRENERLLRTRFPQSDVRLLDMEQPTLDDAEMWDIVHCYGLLYHLKKPDQALTFLAAHTSGMLFLETCVSFGQEESINNVDEPSSNPSQAVSGVGCRPTRQWLMSRLQNLFEYVYVPSTQPNNAEFPIDWTAPKQHKVSLQRAIFVASRAPIENEQLLHHLPDQQSRHP